MNRSKRLDAVLNEFWLSDHDTPEERLAALVRFARRRVMREGSHLARQREWCRRQFATARRGHMRQADDGDWLPCFVCWRASVHRHHIVQLCRGGDNRRRNWVWICREHHEAVHPHMRQSRPAPVPAARDMRPRLVRRSA